MSPFENHLVEASMPQTEPQLSKHDIHSVSRNSEAPPTRASHKAERDAEDNLTISNSNTGIACRLFQSAVSLLSGLLKKSKNGFLHRDDEATLIRILQSLVLWGATHGASSAYLELVLKQSARLQRSTVAPLRLMNEIIVQDLLHHSLSPEDAAGLLSESDVLGLLQQSRHIVDGKDDTLEELDEGIDSESVDEDFIQDTTEALKVLKTCMDCLVDLRSPLETLPSTFNAPDRESANSQREPLTPQSPASETDSNIYSKPVDKASSIESHSPQPTTVERVTKSGRQLIYEVTVRQQPERSRACSTNPNSVRDRRSIDPPPVLQLRIFEGPSIESGKDITFSYNANFFVFTSLEHAHATVHSSGQGATPVLVGMPVSGMAYLDRPIEAGYFVFPELSVRHAGTYRLVFNLYEESRENKNLDPQAESSESQINSAHLGGSTASFDWRMEVKSQPFVVYSPKTFPGLLGNTSCTKILAEQGCQVPIKRDVLDIELSQGDLKQ